MTSTKKTLRATFAAIAAATLTMTATPYAFAEGDGSEPGGPTDTARQGGTDGTELNIAGMPKHATLKVHKTTNPPEEEGDGLEKTIENKVPVKDVTFTVYKFGSFDTGTNAGWRETAKYAKAFNAAPVAKQEAALSTRKFIFKEEAGGGFSYPESEGDGATTVEIQPDFSDGESQYGPKAVDTDEQGLAEFPNLPRGFYLVVESVNRNRTALKNGKGVWETLADSKKELTGAKPFVVSVPMTHPTERNKWLDEINVYPKNSVTGISKSVEDLPAPSAGAGEESAIVYTVKTDVPRGFGKEENGVFTNVEGDESYLSNYQILDQFPEQVTYQDSEVALELGTGSFGDDEQLGNGDYTVDGTSGNIRLVFTKQGRKKLVEVRHKHKDDTLKVVWKLKGQVNKLSMEESSYVDVINKAFLVPPNKYTDDWNPGTDEPDLPKVDVESKYGAIKIVKKDSVSKKGLNGAVFEVYTCTEAGKKTVYDTESKQFVEDTNNAARALFVGDSSTFTTSGQTDDGGDKGEVKIEGLQLNDWNNDDSMRGEDGLRTKNVGYYCLFETQAPEGHELLANPIVFQLLTTDKNTAFKEIEIENVPKNAGFNLPLTGGKGVLPLIALGGLLVVGAGGYAAVAAKRNRKEA